MCADRALEGSRLADMGVAAVPADPHLLFLTGKDLALLEVGGKGSSAVISSSISFTSSSKFADAPSNAGAACAAGTARRSPLSTNAAASRVILFIG